MASAASARPVADARVEVQPSRGGRSRALLAVADLARRRGSRCLVVWQGGVPIAEAYWRGFGPGSVAPVYSVTKSITSTLVGIARDSGALALDEPVARTVESWRGTPSEGVTIRNLLALDSGRHWDYDTDYRRLVEARDATRFAIELPGIPRPQADPPGTRWVYNNTAIQVLDRVLSTATGMPTAEYARQKLFLPLGMDARFRTDWHGQALVYGGLEASCRDLARFAALVSRRGRWGDRVVVSAEWLAEATGHAGSTNAAYGLLWWLNREGRWEAPTFDRPGQVGEGRIFGSVLPASFVLARGHGEQLAGILVDDDVVFARLGDAAGDAFVQELSEAIHRAVHADG